MITRGDDYPVHQTGRPVAFSANPADRNHYERFFFDGYPIDGSWFFAVGAAVYPNRGIMDASVSVVHDGVQTNLRASRHMPRDFLDIEVGPIRISIVEPLRRLRVTVAPNDSGLSGEVEFVARGPAVEEGPYISRIGPMALTDYMRFTQQGGYEGSLTIGGTTLTAAPQDTWGCRDRSWGSRPVGDSDPTSGPQMMRLAQLYPPESRRAPLLFLWAPLNFERKVVLWTVSRGMGDPFQGAMIADADPSAEPARTGEVGHRLTLRETSNHIASAELDFRAGGARHRVELTPLYDFSMSGIGYGHPEWGHGRSHGELEVGFDSFKVADADRRDRLHTHVQTVCRATLDGGDQGVGVLEQIVTNYTPEALPDA